LYTKAMSKHPNGKLFMFDGPDGVGKTTQLELATTVLEERGHDVYVTRINGGPPINEAFRNILLSDIPRHPMTEHLVFMAMHNQHREDLRPRLEAGQIVLMDRSPLSDWAYQVHGGILKNEKAKANIKRSMALFNPDLLICYQAALATLKAHLQRRDNGAKTDYFESKPDDFHIRVIDGYAEASQIFSASVINVSGTIDEIHEQTMALIDKALTLNH
jgi:dTMP kinase